MGTTLAQRMRTLGGRSEPRATEGLTSISSDAQSRVLRAPRNRGASSARACRYTTGSSARAGQ